MRHGKLPFSFGVRTKVVLASGILMLIPWLGYRFIVDMDHALREGQQRALVDLARLVVAVLRDTPPLLQQRAIEGQEGGQRQLVPVLHEPIRLDGDIQDWISQGADVQAYGGEQLIELHRPWSAKSLSFSHAIGRFENYLYAFFEVTDDHVVYCPANGIRADACDQLRISITGDDARYIVAASAPGPLTALRIPEGGRTQPAPDPAIAGVWRETASGYTIEIRLRAAAAGRPGFAIVDVDDGGDRRVSAVIAASEARGPVTAQAAFSATPELQRFVESILEPGSRLWIVDRTQRVVLRSNGSQRAVPADSAVASEKHNDLWRSFEANVLQPIYPLILAQPDERSGNAPATAPDLDKGEIERALAEKAGPGDLQAHDARTPFVSAGYPIVLGDQVVGAVIVKQAAREFGDIRRRAAGRTLTATMAALALAVLGLIVYASHISTRIRRLRAAAERAIDPVGRVRGPVSGSNAGDELGDLARTISELLDRLAQYTGYLENMARRLGHELRTPIGVVRSSLDNLRMHKLPDEMLVYLERADDGLTRLNAILTRMSESTRLEQIMKQSDREHFDLGKVAASCVEGYRSAYPGKHIRFAGPGTPIPITGVPDLIAQMLDKLVENATDFSKEGTPVEIQLSVEPANVALTVRNEGPPLPSEMADRLFDSMVSVRAAKSGSSVHLGLGLYIVHLVALFHYGRAWATNRADGKGVEITVRLPRYVSDPA